MLPQFRVSQEEAIQVQGDDLKATVAGIFEKMGVPESDAEVGADALVLADLRGVDSHGVSNMLRSYVSGYTTGQINPRPDISIVRETPATASMDSDRGLGTITTPKAMELAIRKASEVGVGMVTIGNARHLGMASYHAMLALEHDMIGVCMTSCPPRTLPTFGAEPRLGTNPIAIAVPAKNDHPFVFDAATSSVAQNKIEIARRLGAKLEPGWLATEDGVPGIPVKMPDIKPPDSPPTSTLIMVARPCAGGMLKVKGRVSTTAMAMVKPGMEPASSPGPTPSTSRPPTRWSTIATCAAAIAGW